MALAAPAGGRRARGAVDVQRLPAALPARLARALQLLLGMAHRRAGAASDRLQVLLVGVLVVEGALGAWPGWLGLGIAIASLGLPLAIPPSGPRRRRKRSSAGSRTASAATTAPRSCRRRRSTSRKASSGVRSRCRSPSGIRRSSACATSPTSTSPAIACTSTSIVIAIIPPAVPPCSRCTAEDGCSAARTSRGCP